ncbi:uncharacterized protein [Triticum aestivum]|uniref:uncharacterized protein n=1 Tax=Triticum aestivum TaxID=4565 RepID=UPI001D028611|nr:uncharacterized protein LOC123044721 [Triticum aestivum]
MFFLSISGSIIGKFVPSRLLRVPADLSVLIFPGFVFCDRAPERLHLDGRSEGFAVDKLTGLSTPNNGVGPLTCGFCWYQEKEVPFNLQELCQWQRAFLDNDVVLHVRKMQRVKSAQEGILQAAPNPILWDRVKCGSVIELSMKEEDTSTSPSNKDCGNGDGSVSRRA